MILISYGYSLNEDFRYRAVVKEAHSLGLTLTQAETNAEAEKHASSDVHLYRDLIKMVPSGADDLTFAKIVDTEFARRAATRAPGTALIGEAPNAFTRSAQQRADVIQMRQTFSP